jgi:DNA polymerase-1
MDLIKNQDYIYVETLEQLKDMCAALEKETEIAIDSETYLTSDPNCDNQYNRSKTGPAAFDPHTARVRLIQLKGRDTIPYVVDLLRLEDHSLLKTLLVRDDVLWIGHNIKFDIKMFAGTLGVWLKKVWCTMQASILIRNGVGFMERGNGLADISRDFLSLNLDKTEQISDWSITDLRDEQLEYAALDVVNLHELKDILNGTLVNDYKMPEVVQLEMGVILPTARMEYNGIPFNKDMYTMCQEAANFAIPGLLQQIGKFFHEKIGQTIAITYVDLHNDGTEVVPFKLPWGGGKAGKDLLMSKTAMVLPMLQELGLDIDNVQKTTLEAYKENNPGVASLIDFYNLVKQAQFDYEKYIHPVTGRIHPGFKISGATTGRFSCTSPNVQQVPSKVTMVHKSTGTSVNYRYCFEADPGWLICSADFSGQELAVMAAMSGDEAMCKILNENGDLHGEAAAGMFNISLAEVRDKIPGGNGQTYRDRGKIVMFSLAYGKTAKGFADDWGISEKEAKDLIKGFEKRFPQLTKWLKYHGELGVAQGFSKLANGAMRFVAENTRDKDAAYRAAMNFQIQGLSSWMTRLAMIKLDQVIQDNNLPMQLIACIHDELLVTFRTDDNCPLKFVREGHITDPEHIAKREQDCKDHCHENGVEDCVTRYETIVGECMKDAGEYFLKGIVPAGFSLATKRYWAH